MRTPAASGRLSSLIPDNRETLFQQALPQAGSPFRRRHEYKRLDLLRSSQLGHFLEKQFHLAMKRRYTLYRDTDDGLRFGIGHFCIIRARYRILACFAAPTKSPQPNRFFRISGFSFTSLPKKLPLAGRFIENHCRLRRQVRQKRGKRARMLRFGIWQYFRRSNIGNERWLSSSYSRSESISSPKSSIRTGRSRLTG